MTEEKEQPKVTKEKRNGLANGNPEPRREDSKTDDQNDNTAASI